MIYQRRPPASQLATIINCYWLIDSEGDTSIDRQKIVPDGFPELIIHYKDAYRIKLGDDWQLQEKRLFAGQIKNHFYLENTEASGMIGIKLSPTAITHLFDLDMSQFTGKVVSMPEGIDNLLSDLDLTIVPDFEAIFNQLDDTFTDFIDSQDFEEKPVDKAIQLIFQNHGNLSLKELAEACYCSERQLERQFKHYIGLSPKFYSRIIRLGYIFELMQQGDPSWSDLVYDSGFYDQSHFIKNFQEFTGEDPSSYGFDEENMANFHLRK